MAEQVGAVCRQREDRAAKLDLRCRPRDQSRAHDQWHVPAQVKLSNQARFAQVSRYGPTLTCTNQKVMGRGRLGPFTSGTGRTGENWRGVLAYVVTGVMTVACG